MLDDRDIFTRFRRENHVGGFGIESPILRAYQQTQNCTKGIVLSVTDMGFNNYDRCTVSFRGEQIGATCCHPEIVVDMPVSIIERPRGRYWATVFQNSWYSRPLIEVARKGKPVTAAIEWILSRGSKWRPDLILFDKTWQRDYDPDDEGGGGGGSTGSTRDSFDILDVDGTGITLAQWLAEDLPECIFRDFDSNSNDLVSVEEWTAKMPRELVVHGSGSCFVRANPTFGRATFSTFAYRTKGSLSVYIVEPDGGDALGGFFIYVPFSELRYLTAVYFLTPALCPALDFSTFVFLTVHDSHIGG